MKPQKNVQLLPKYASFRKQHPMKKNIIACLVSCGLALLFTGHLFADEKEKKSDKPTNETKSDKVKSEKKEDPQSDDSKKTEPKKKEEPAKTTPDIKAIPLALNLENPSGLAIHPETGHVFIASRYGVYQYDPNPTDHSIKIAIDTFPTDVYGKGPQYSIGPLGLSFIDKEHLVVADGSRKDGEELVRIYKLTDGNVDKKADEKYAAEDSAVHTLGPIKASEKSEKGEGNFFGVTVGASSIFVTCNGDDSKGWVAKSELKDGKPGKLDLFLATKEAVKVDAPAAIIMSVDGKELWVSQMGEISKAGDSLLATYNPADGKLIKKYETGLNDIVGLAISPKTKKIYATDFSWIDTSKGGLFELIIDGDKITTQKIISLDKPAAIAFNKEGLLYISEFGTAKPGKKEDDKKEDDSKKKAEPMAPGRLLMIDAGL